MAALENFDPGHWYDVLLDGPKKQEPLENIKLSIRIKGAFRDTVPGLLFQHHRRLGQDGDTICQRQSAGSWMS